MTNPKKSYGDLKAELDEVLSSLQRDDIDVDEALKAYERGMELIGELKALLKAAENKVTKLKARFED